MQIIYNLFISLTEFLLPIAGIFSHKMKLFVKGRKEIFQRLKSEIQVGEKYIWIHAASLGEFEQAVPVIELLKEKYPGHRILVTFFSPSGYENKKKHPLADVITYLPIDTPGNARKFLELVKPELVFFVKYDIWPNFLQEIKQRGIRSFLISGVFRKDQVYFKSYGSWMKKALQSFEHIFVQNQESKELLEKNGFNNVSLSGDTRFDRVSRQLTYDNKLEILENFLQDELCIVAGSTWPEDEELLLEYINSAPAKVKFIIAPHEIKAEKINDFRKKLKVSSVLYSETSSQEPKDFQLLIIDNIGLLSRIYSYADIAYVGGAAGNTGLHNILEPATFGIPIVIGENFEKFPEAKRLQQLAGLYSVASAAELMEIFEKLVKNQDFRKQTGMIAGHFINSNTGATRVISTYLSERP
ncbi:3-deoxy-D-manno-octulosonic acid transferase [Salegentibacter flavus]|uniref:3-deoxy-D-manno-octulosonic acid transferase n=1 Tax=Salegentibacter flavus TaxID=287099 RepID=A0A1I4YYS3_9FLAO|nr:glycosyltransferase N-terminal domain-containing protein [Salegentibacter flavus]SFN43206.1 3-deoxy-D-manno-octulosonic-acid transferase [Salegentibacter flavus]